MKELLMPAGHRLAYEISGQGPGWLVMSHSIGCSKEMWRGQVAMLSESFRVLTYDLPGHGGSESTGRTGSLDGLADDLFSVMDGLSVEAAHFIGVSIGGMIGQVAALARPERFTGLVLANTSGRMPEPTHPDWQARIAKARRDGVASLAGPSLERWFTPAFRRDHAAVIASLQADFERTLVDGYVECCEAIMGLSTLDRLPALQVPTLVISGTRDVGAPPAAARAMTDCIPDARLALIDDAGHLSCVDHPEEFNNLCSEFFQELGCTPLAIARESRS